MLLRDILVRNFPKEMLTKQFFEKKETAIGRINIASQCSVYMKKKVNVICKAQIK